MQKLEWMMMHVHELTLLLLCVVIVERVAHLLAHPDYLLHCYRLYRTDWQVRLSLRFSLLYLMEQLQRQLLVSLVAV
jgi:hypothetical protein